MRKLASNILSTIAFVAIISLFSSDKLLADTFTSHLKSNTDSTLDIGTFSLLWRFVYADAITDNTATWGNSSLSGFTSISGTTLTDTVLSVTGGSIASAVNGTFSGTLTAGTLTDSSATLTGGTLTATTLTDGTASLTGGVFSSLTLASPEITGTVNAGGGLVTFGGPVTVTGTLTANGDFTNDTITLVNGTWSILDSSTVAWVITEDVNSYMDITTLNGSENISFGNVTTDPTYKFSGDGLFTHNGNVTIDILGDPDAILTMDGSSSSPGTLRYESDNNLFLFDQALEVGGMEGAGAPGNLGIKSDGGALAIRIEENSGVEGWHIGVDADGDLNFDDSNTGIKITFQDETGRVGIGAVDPSKTLELRTGVPVIRLRDTGDTTTATTAFVEFGGTTASNWDRTGYIGDGSSGDTHIRVRAEDSDLYLGDSSGEQVLILSDGDATFSGDVTVDANSTLGAAASASTTLTLRNSGTDVVLTSTTGLLSIDQDLSVLDGLLTIIDGSPTVKMTFGSTRGFQLTGTDAPAGTLGRPLTFIGQSAGAEASSGTGKTGGKITTSAGTGGTSAIAGTDNIGGIGGLFEFVGGTGGNASLGSNTTTGGLGGQTTLAGGTGGLADHPIAIGGKGGDSIFTGGVGGIGSDFITFGGLNVGGDGGDSFVKGGDGGTGGGSGGTQGDGGNIFIDGGAGDTDGCIYLGGTTGNVRIGDTTTPTDALEVVGVSVFGDGGATNYTQLSATGVQTMAGTARVRKHIIIPVESAMFGSSAPSTAFIGNFAVDQFSQNSPVQSIYMTWHIPTDWAVGTDIAIHIHWAPVNGNAGDVVWDIDYKAVASEVNEVLSGAGTALTTTDSTQTLQDELLESPDMTIAGAGIALEDTLGLKISRDTDDGADNYGAAASLVLVEISYIADKLGEGT